MARGRRPMPPEDRALMRMLSVYRKESPTVEDLEVKRLLDKIGKVLSAAVSSRMAGAPMILDLSIAVNEDFLK